MDLFQIVLLFSTELFLELLPLHVLLVNVHWLFRCYEELVRDTDILFQLCVHESGVEVLAASEDVESFSDDPIELLQTGLRDFLDFLRFLSFGQECSLKRHQGELLDFHLLRGTRAQVLRVLLLFQLDVRAVKESGLVVLVIPLAL